MEAFDVPFYWQIRRRNFASRSWGINNTSCSFRSSILRINKQCLDRYFIADIIKKCLGIKRKKSFFSRIVKNNSVQHKLIFPSIVRNLYIRIFYVISFYMSSDSLRIFKGKRFAIEIEKHWSGPQPWNRERRRSRRSLPLVRGGGIMNINCSSFRATSRLGQKC